MNDSFHAGEREAQQRAGETAIADRNISVMTDKVIGGARPFIAKLFMAVVGSTDADGRVWASLLFGKPGFVQTNDGSSILINIPQQERDLSDPFWSNIQAIPDIGMLFIELGSRRRYRVNGKLSRLDAEGAEVAIREAYPNCPKYIQRRQLRRMGEPVVPVQTAHGTVLRGPVEQIIQQADTLFLASRHDSAGADASHRGGKPGFIKQMDENTLRIPDYDGNSLFNTLGNFHVNPNAGLCIPDFERGQLLQLTGAATVLWHQEDPHNETGGTKRYWEFKVARWILRDTPQQVEWEYLDASPFNPAVS